MAKLTTAERKALPDSAFAGPNRTYPVNDASHAANAKARAAQNASPAEEKKIDAKANKKLGKSSDSSSTPAKKGSVPAGLAKWQAEHKKKRTPGDAAREALVRRASKKKTKADDGR